MRLAQWATASDAELARELRKLTGKRPPPELMAEARRLLARVLETPGGMRIQTIHAFCQALLARFPLEAGVPPHFEVVDERTADELMAAVREEVIAAAGGPLARALAVVTEHLHETRLQPLMAELASERGRIDRLARRFGGRDRLVRRMRRHLGVEEGLTPEGTRAEACAGGFDRAGLAAACAALGEGTKADRERGGRIAEWLALADADARLRGFDAYAGAFLTKDGAPRATLAAKAVAEAHPQAAAALEAEAARLVAARERERRAVVAQTTEAILTFGLALLDAYRAHKRARNWLDYDDLILAARDLLAGGRAAWVLYKLDGGLDHVLIDEAQDTNPDQWAVVEALAEEFFAGEGAREARRTVFAVGDAKQSIYGFQRADPAYFARMRERFAKRVREAELDWRDVALGASFRSTAAVLKAVDAVFADPAAQDGLVFDDAPIAHVSERRGQAGLVELWPAVEPEKGDSPEPWKPPVERSAATNTQSRLAVLVADKIAALCGEERLESEDRPIGAGDIMVLVRRRTAFMDELVRRLKERDVPVAGIDRLVLTDHIAVMDLVSLGRFLLLPDDDLSLAEVLKSPLFGLDDDDLFDLAWDRGKRSLWRSLEARRGNPRADLARERLGAWLARADMVRPYELFAELLSAPGGRERILARLGAEAIDPLDEFLAQALAYERVHTPSLQGFLHWLESGRVEVKRDLDVGRGDAVRVMTVHGAKGLEAPIVFVPDTLQAPSHTPILTWDPDGEGVLWPPGKALRDAVSQAWIDAAQARERQEYRRLLYVAMTRAAERLYLCGWHTRRAAPERCWYNLIRSGLAGIAEEAEEPLLAHAGLPALVLRVRAPQTAPSDRERAREPQPEEKELPQWVRLPPRPEPTPPLPLVPSATEEPPARSPIALEARRAAERGRLIHRLLQSLPELAPEARVDACRRFLARRALGLDEAMQGDIARAALRVMDDPAFAPVFARGSRAEVAIAGLLPSGRVLSGQIDRLAVTDDAVLAVDYKTGRAAPTRTDEVPQAYLRQMASYRAGLSAIYPDRAVRCALLWTEAPALMPLDDALLDRFAP
jgi:ATP-dependent helicase/nuclease subunit A